jgi:hypothetical protein
MLIASGKLQFYDFYSMLGESKYTSTLVTVGVLLLALAIIKSSNETWCRVIGMLASTMK